MTWIIHYRDATNKDLQYAIRVYESMTYEKLEALLDNHVYIPENKFLTYSRGKNAPFVKIDNSLSLTLAIDYFGEEAYSKDTHLWIC